MKALPRRLLTISLISVVTGGLLAAQALAGSAERKARKARNKAMAVVNERLLAYDTTEARKNLEPVLEEDEPVSLLALGRVLEQEKDYAKADRKLNRAAELQPDDPAPLIYLGESLLHQEKADEARKAFKKAAGLAAALVGKDPKSVDGHFYLGVARRHLGEYNDGAESLGQARELEPGNATIVFQLGALRTAQERWQSAVDLLTTAIGMDSGIAYAYFYRGQAASKVGRKDMLIADFERFLDMAPEAPEAPAVRRVVASVRR